METGKAEIKNLPEGMSSEELDKLTTGEEVEEDTDLAQEALGATEEEPSPAEESVEDEAIAEEEPAEKPDEEKPKVDPKDAVIGDFRRQLRDQELETAKLQGKLEAQESIKAKVEEAPKSPLEIAEDAYIEENGSLDGFAIDGKLYRQQKTFDDEQAASKTTTEKQKQTNSALTQAVETLQDGDLSVKKAGQGLDLQTVAKIGDKYLTKGDAVDLADIQARRGQVAAVKEAYKIMIRRILEAGGDDAKMLKVAINTKSKSQIKPENKGKTDIDALTTEGVEDKGEAETETHSKRLTDFIFFE